MLQYLLAGFESKLGQYVEKKKYFTSNSYHHLKVNFKWVKDLNIKSRNIKPKHYIARITLQ